MNNKFRKELDAGKLHVRFCEGHAQQWVCLLDYEQTELVRYQEKELPAAAGAEKDILTASAIIKSEKNRNEKIGKYVDAITHSVMPEIEKGQWYKGLMGQLSW
mgnify:CR=1 FL=1